jgi:CRP/FNR family transcriptional regulator
VVAEEGAKKSNCLRCAMRARSIFAGLSGEELCALGMDVIDLEFVGGTTIYREGDSASHAYTLREGAIKLVKSLADGRAQIVRLLHHGDLFGFEGLHREQHQHTAIALSTVKLCRLDLRELDLLSQRLPAVREAIFRRWQRALEEAENRIVDLGTRRAEARLATFLLQWAQAYPQRRSLPFPLTRQDLGEFLGLSTEHVSRIMADFKRRNWLRESRGELEILDPKALGAVGAS